MIKIKQTISWLVVGAAVLAATYINAAGQQQPAVAAQDQAEPQQRAQDPIRQLNLTPEQRERIRGIREQFRDERASVGQRLAESNQALQKELDSDNPDEARLENLIKDVAVSQAAVMRLRILNEVKIRRVLTPEQIVTLRRLQLEARQERRLDRVRRRQDAFDGQRGLLNRRSHRPLDRPIVPQRRARP